MREKFITGQIYHILNRGVDKRKIFLDDGDYLRFIHDLFEFNNTEPVNNLTYYFRKIQYKDSASPYIITQERKERVKRKLLVEILAFCLLPNHYHLLLQPLLDGGVVKFITKLNMGYAKYFNEKYERNGVLFQGRYKSILVNKESHFIHLPYYIHLNALDLKFPGWRNKEIENYKAAMRFLENYRWSSFPDYIGIKNFPSITQREFLLKLFGESEQYKKDTLEWLKEMDLEEIKAVALE